MEVQLVQVSPLVPSVPPLKAVVESAGAKLLQAPVAALPPEGPMLVLAVMRDREKVAQADGPAGAAMEQFSAVVLAPLIVLVHVVV